MLSRNQTRFAAMGFSDLHRDGMTMAVICVRGSYDLSQEGALKLSGDQRIVLSDVHEGDMQRTPLLKVTDLIPFKPAADITLIGPTEAPGHLPSPSWRVGLEVGTHAAWLRVFGQRRWEPTLKRLRPSWKLGPPEPARRVSLDYRLASGGRIVGDPEGDVDPRNPIGPGILHADHSRLGTPLRAPQIDSETAPVLVPFDDPEPQGWGPVPPWWLWRQRYAGTYDEAWKRERHPQLPIDFDYRFYQTANPNLVVPSLLGDEAIRLYGLGPNGADIGFELPGIAVVADHQWFDGRRILARLKLDGLHIDLRSSPWKIDLTWRGWIAACPSYDCGSIFDAPVAETTRLPVSVELGLGEEAI